VNYARGPGLALSDDIPGEIPGIFTPGICEDFDFPYDLPGPAPESDGISLGGDWGLGESAQLYVNGISYDDIRQGCVSDCSMMATIASVTSLNPNFIRDAIVVNHNNTYTVLMWFLTQAIPLVVWLPSPWNQHGWLIGALSG
jgi:hypothetical protein